MDRGSHRAGGLRRCAEEAFRASGSSKPGAERPSCPIASGDGALSAIADVDRGVEGDCWRCRGRRWGQNSALRAWPRRDVGRSSPRCTASRKQRSGRRRGAGFEGIAPATRGEVAQDMIHDGRVSDHRDDGHLDAAAGTQKRVHFQDPPQQPRPGGAAAFSLGGKGLLVVVLGRFVLGRSAGAESSRSPRAGGVSAVVMVGMRTCGASMARRFGSPTRAIRCLARK